MDRALLVDSKRCVNTTFAGVNCTRCRDTCPVDAIQVTGRSTQIDDSACIDCGACLPACPTEAITPRTPTPYLRLAFADLPRSEGVVISCPRRQRHDADVNVIRHERCLAELGAEQLFELVAGSARDVWLDDADCASCELAPLGRQIEHAVDGANSLVQGFDHPPTVHLATAVEPASASRRPGVVVAARRGGMSRRGLFRRLIGEVTERVSLETGDDRLPPRRRRLLATLDKLSPPPSGSTAEIDAAGFGDVSVDIDGCSACGLCATFCPTEALAFTTSTDPKGDRFDLRAQAARCVDCGVCTAACPEAAITVEARAGLRALLDRSFTTVASGSLVACEVCGAPVAGSPGLSKRCFSCRGGVVSPLRDEAGLMADLLSRLPREA